MRKIAFSVKRTNLTKSSRQTDEQAQMYREHRRRAKDPQGMRSSLQEQNGVLRWMHNG